MKKRRFGIVFADNGEELLDEISADDEKHALEIFADKHHEFYKDEWHISYIGSAPYLVTDTVNVITAFHMGGW